MNCCLYIDLEKMTLLICIQLSLNDRNKEIKYLVVNRNHKKANSSTDVITRFEMMTTGKSKIDKVAPKGNK